MEKLIEIIQENASREYDKFREEELSKDKEEIYKDHSIINFFEELFWFINTFELIESIDKEVLEFLSEDGISLISNLYIYYLKNEYASVSNSEEIENLIYGYYVRYKDS